MISISLQRFIVSLRKKYSASSEYYYIKHAGFGASGFMHYSSCALYAAADIIVCVSGKSLLWTDLS
jgi:hypothetical protein